MRSIFDSERDDRRSFHVESIRQAPRLDAPVTSRGSRLPHLLRRYPPLRVSIAGRWGCALIILTIATGSGFGVWFLDTRLPAEHTWSLIVLGLSAIIFGLFAVYMLAGAIRLSLAARTPRTELEIGDVDLRPGARTSLYVMQRGPAKLNRLAVMLRCLDVETLTSSWTEQVVDEDGIERPVNRSESQYFETPLEWTLFERASITIDERLPFEVTIEITIPTAALPTGSTSKKKGVTAESMPSAVPWDARSVRQTIATSVSWTIVVVGDVDGQVDFTHEFPIVVFP